MNRSIVRYIVCWSLLIESGFLLISSFVGFLYRESSAWYLVLGALICFLVGGIGVLRKPKKPTFYAKEGFVSVAMTWIAMSFFGAIPFYMSGHIPNLVDALFETVSGFTTTGASILSNVEAMPKGLLFWRSFTHWIGGMGVLVFLLAILPKTKNQDGSSIQLLRAESPGPSVGKLVPRIQTTTRILYTIYFTMTITEIIILLIGRMPLFDAVTLSFGSAGTGGFAIKNDSLASYTLFQQGVITISMLLFGVNFYIYFLVTQKRWKEAIRSEEMILYFGIFLTASLLIAVNTYKDYHNFFLSFHHAAFQVSSIMTTTGYATVDFNLWPVFSRGILVLLMFIGASAGSTGGGIKVGRILIYFKDAKREIGRLLHPRSVKVVQFEGKPLEDSVLKNAFFFLFIYIVIFVSSITIISLDGKDLVTNFTAVAATLNNIGPGLELVGPTQNFGSFGSITKCVLIFDMLAGRLELFPMLILMVPSTWRRS